MTFITREEVIKLSKISALEIQEHEIGELVHELQAVLSYVSSLQKVVQQYESSTGAELLKNINVVRPDVPVAYATEQLLERAPQREGNYFVVPLIVKQP